MTNADRPFLPALVVPREIEIAAGVDRIVAHAPKLLRRHVDSEAFRNRAEVEQKMAVQRHGARAFIDLDVAKADSLGCDRCRNRTAAAILAIESARLHNAPDRGIERAFSLLGKRDRQTQ